MNLKWTLLLVGAIALGTAALAEPQVQELPSDVSKYMSKQYIVRALVRLGSTGPERWFVVYDLTEQGCVALIEGDALTDDKAFETKRTFGNKLSLRSVKSIYFSIVTFSPGVLT